MRQIIHKIYSLVCSGFVALNLVMPTAVSANEITIPAEPIEENSNSENNAIEVQAGEMEAGAEEIVLSDETAAAEEENSFNSNAEEMELSLPEEPEASVPEAAPAAEQSEAVDSSKEQSEIVLTESEAEEELPVDSRSRNPDQQNAPPKRNLAFFSNNPDGSVNLNDCLTGTPTIMIGDEYGSDRIVSPDANGVYQLPETLGSNQYIILQTSYSIPVGELPSDGRAVFDFPGKPFDFSNSELSGSGNVVNDGGQTIGTYTITAQGHLTATFFESAVNANTSSPVTGRISGKCGLNWDGIDSGNVTELTFGRDIHISVQEKIQQTLDGEKTAVDNKDGTISYTVRIFTETGVSDPIRISDVLEKPLQNPHGFTIAGPERTGVSSVNPHVNNLPDGNTEWQVTFPALNAGEEYTFSYTADVDPSDVLASNLKNTVRASSKDTDQKEITVTKETNTPKETAISISKSGVLSDDKKNANWTITIDSSADLAGWELSDLLDNVPYTGTAAISPAVGGTETITFPFTFPAASTGRYVITYSTPIELEPGQDGVSNQAFLKHGNDELKSEIASVRTDGPGFHPAWKKNKGVIEKEEADTVTFQWEVGVDTKVSALKAPWVIEDKIDAGDHYFTGAQILLMKEAAEKAFAGYGVNIQAYENHYTNDPVSQINPDGRYKKFTISSSKPVAQGVKITVPVESTMAQRMSEYEGENKFKNTVSIGQDTMYAYQQYDRVSVNPKLVKQSSDGQTQNTVSEVNSEKTISWKLKLEVPRDYGKDLTITDALPEGLELKSVSYSGKNLLEEDYDSISAEADGNVASIHIPGSKSNGYKREYEFIVTAAITNMDEWTEDSNPDAHRTMYTYNNTAVLLNENSEEITSSSQSQTITKTRGQNLIKKSIDGEQGSKRANNIETYRLEINPEGEKMLPEGIETFRIEDSIHLYAHFKARMSLVPGSLSITNTRTGEQLDPSSYSASIDEQPFIENDSGDGNQYSTLIIENLPDETPLSIVYQYQIKKDPAVDTGSLSDNDAYLSINNEAKLIGSAYGEQKGSADGGARWDAADMTGNFVGLSLYKVDSKNVGIVLQGAEFDIETWNGSDWENAGTARSDVNGNIKLDNTGYFDQLIKLTETKAPAGYKKNDVSYYFYLQTVDDSGKLKPVQIPEALSNLNFDKFVRNGQMNIPNDKSDEPTPFEHEIQFKGTKVVKKASGSSADSITEPAEAGKFQFVLKQVVSDENGEEQEVQIGEVISNENNGVIEFDKLTFSSADVKPYDHFVYRVYEVTPSDENKVPGMTYAEEPVEITVNIIAEGEKGDFRIETSENAKNFEIENTYEEPKTSLSLSGSKSITGIDNVDIADYAGQFRFSLYQVEDSSEDAADEDLAEESENQNTTLPAETKIETAINGETGSFAFTDLNYTIDDLDKTYIYRVKEDADVPAGFSADPTVHEIEVTIQLDENGALQAVTNNDTLLSNLNFVNAYNEGSFTPEVTKLVNSQSYEGNQTFEFVLKDEQGEEIERKTAVNGKAVFSEISYNTEGTYHYTISEVKDEPVSAGWTYDQSDISLDVTVVKENGSFIVTPVYSKDGTEGVQTFNNTYTASGSIQFEGTKTLNGADLADYAEAFEFVLSEVVENSDGESDVQTRQTVNNRADGTFEFDAIEYTLDDLGTHTYRISETNGSEANMSYDPTVYEITVTVSDGQDGTLNVESSIPADSLSFENTHTEPEKEKVSVELQASKILENGTLEGEDFTFNLFRVSEDGTEVPVDTKTNDAQGVICFDAIEFNEEEIGEHNFVIREQSGVKPGITYDSAQKQVVVTVSKDADGNLSASTTAPDGVVFTNTCNASGSWQPQAEKVLEGRELEDNEFSFTLSEIYSDGTSRVLQSTYAKADGSIEFEEIQYGVNNIGTHIYQIAEVRGNDPTIQYDSAVYEVQVTVEDAKDGTLNVTPVISNAETIQFTNTYRPLSSSFVISASKTLTGKNLEEGQFTFKLYPEGSEEPVQTTTNDAQGRIAFDAIEATEAGTFTYIIKEAALENPVKGLSMDEREFRAVVEVTETDGHLIAEVSYPDGNAFVNTYEKTGSVQISGTKILEGRELQDREFRFSLLKEGETEPRYALNDQDGRFAFELSFDQNDIGSHIYTLKEETGSDSEIDYDANEYQVVVTVSDDPEMDDLQINVEATPQSELDESQQGIVFINEVLRHQSVTISKTWDDNNDQDGIRPDHVNVTLLKDGTSVETTVI